MELRDTGSLVLRLEILFIGPRFGRLRQAFELKSLVKNGGWRRYEFLFSVDYAKSFGRG
jgi:hypothetical protein